MLKRKTHMGGQAAVEFVLLLPILAMLLTIGLDCARLYTASSAAQSIASDTARWAATKLSAHEELDLAAVNTYASSTGLVPSEAKITYTVSDAPAESYTIQLLNDDGTEAESQAVHDKKRSVTVQVDIPITLFLAIPPLSLKAVDGVYTVGASATSICSVGTEL